MGQGLAFQEFHNKVVDAILLADVIQRADMRIAQTRNGAGLTFKTFADLRTGGTVLEENFDGDDAIETGVPRADRPRPFLRHRELTGSRTGRDECRRKEPSLVTLRLLILTPKCGG